MTTEYHVDPDLTSDEQAILDADKAETDKAAADAQAAKDAQAAADAAEAARLAAEEANKPDPTAEALAAQAAEARALRERIEAMEAAAAAEKAARDAAANPPRDYEAERAALQKRYDEDDDYTTEQWRKDEREIDRAEAKAEAMADVQRQVQEQAEAARKAAESAEDARWDAAKAKFFADPENAKLVADKIRTAGFVAAIEEAAGEGITDFDQILVKAREKVTGVPAVDTSKALRDAQFQRDKDANAVAPNTLRDVPNTSNPGDTPGASLDNLDISDLEDALARMSDADRERYRASAPGGLQDNPRAA